MIKSYFKLAFRNLVKRKDYSMLNILGLAIGTSCCLLIFQYVAFERSYDNFLPDSNQIFRLRLDHYQQGRLDWQSAAVYPAFGPTMKKDLPEVEDYCRLSPAPLLLSNELSTIKFNETKGYYADPSFLPMFNIRVLKGNPKTALNGMDKIMLSAETARKYFGKDDALGKTLIFHSPFSERPFEVTGIFDALPGNSHLVVNYLVSYPTLGFFPHRYNDSSHPEETSWGWYQFYTYLRLKPGTNIQKFESKLPAFCDHYINSQASQKENNIRDEVHIIPVSDIHLHSHYMQEAEVNGNARAVSFLFMIAFLIIGIAWVNYINLSTARSLERAREVGVRKLIGAVRSTLIGQFLVESILINLFSFLLALFIAATVTPWFSQMIGNGHPAYFYLPFDYWLLMIGVFLVGSLLSGIYPAFILSGFKPVSVLKGLFKNSVAGLALRKGLIILQFTISVVLIIGTFVVYRQVNYMRSQPLGANVAQTLVVGGPFSLEYHKYDNIYQPFKNAVLDLPGVKNMTASTGVMGKENTWANAVWRLDAAYPNPVTLHFLGVDYAFLPSYEIKLVAGRNFSKDFPSDSSAVILNESALPVLGFENAEKAIGQKLKRGDTMSIIGVIKDFHTESLNKNIDPELITLLPTVRSDYSIKIESANMAAVIHSIQTAWDKYFPNDPFNYYFLDESFNAQYKADAQFGKLFGGFALLAIIIACVGLMGLSAYNVLQRRKEIGIRKVLGASIVSVFSILSKEFLQLVFIAIIIASPVAWFIMHRWLENYAYRIKISGWIIIIAGLLVV
ncbi:MAG TPA: ABC transporter permease, partial [Chitinophagaceae bacterium]